MSTVRPGQDRNFDADPTLADCIIDDKVLCFDCNRIMYWEAGSSVDKFKEGLTDDLLRGVHHRSLQSAQPNQASKQTRLGQTTSLRIEACHFGKK
ncbi:unnamed protein product [Calypogeia fissa]